jgi:hypothetical protein
MMPRLAVKRLSILTRETTNSLVKRASVG